MIKRTTRCLIIFKKPRKMTNDFFDSNKDANLVYRMGSTTFI